MIIYSNDKKLIITTMEDINENVDLFSLYLEAESFNGRENRFFKILSVNSVTRSIKHLTQESMANEARKRFQEMTNINNSLKYYDKEHNIGYKVFPYIKNPTIYSYSIVFPAITEFFQYWKEYSYTGDSMREFLPKYDLSKLFGSMNNFSDIHFILTKEQAELIKKTLYQEFPEFAIFYYEIYPYLNLETVCCYNLSKLINAKLLVHELGLDTSELDNLIDSLDVAKNNGKVLKLIKNLK